MKQIGLLFFIFVLTANFIYSDILDENEYYKKAVELFDSAVLEYENGDYDKGYQYSESAKENIDKAYEYNEVYILKIKLETKREIAGLKMDEAYLMGAENDVAVSGKFSEAALLFENGDKYYDAGDLTTDLATKKNAYEKGIDKYVEVSGIASKILSALSDKTKKSVVKSKDPRILALKGEAEELIKKTKKELSYAKEKADETTYQGKIKEADLIFDRALLAFDEEKYDECIAGLNNVNSIIGSINFGLVFPKYYKIKLTPDDRDSLWKIAGYDFVYSDGSKWLLLYEANKVRLKYPRNPNIILPEKIIEIPSANGEKRRGVYNPNRTYPKFDPDKNYRE